MSVSAQVGGKRCRVQLRRHRHHTAASASLPIRAQAEQQQPLLQNPLSLPQRIDNSRAQDFHAHPGVSPLASEKESSGLLQTSALFFSARRAARLNEQTAGHWLAIASDCQASSSETRSQLNALHCFFSTVST